MPIELLEAWLSEEGIETGARCVQHIEFDSNWSAAFRVVLWDKSTDPPLEYIGEAPGVIGGLAVAINNALKKAMEAVHAD